MGTVFAYHNLSSSVEIKGTFGPDTTPLTVVAHVISFLEDDICTLARLCRTSRILYYMTVPHLWRAVTLTSYKTIRYKDDIPEGFGRASPFSMGLNALVTRNVSNLVQTLTFEGEWAAHDVKENSKVGRVSEIEMILNISIRAAVDRCTNLEHFRWDLNTKLQPNVYAGLTALKRLKSLHVRFPSTRTPQPTTELPAFPHLQYFTVTHYDPLCYPDDISRLLLHANSLVSLQLHFSPRMREQGEPSVHLSHFFRKIIAQGRELKVKRIGMYNLFAYPEDTDMIEMEGIEEVTMLNTIGSEDDPTLSTGFVDHEWKKAHKHEEPSPKSVRVNEFNRHMAQYIAKADGLEKLYLINHRSINGHSANNTPSATRALSSPSQASGSADSNESGSWTPSATTTATIRDMYLEGICNVAGPTLQHLILPARWPLSVQSFARLVRSCPNLTQLSIALDNTEMKVMRMLVPFLKKLKAIRVQSPVAPGEEGIRMAEEFERFVNKNDCVHEHMIGIELGVGYDDVSKADFPMIQYLALGTKIWQALGVQEIQSDTPQSEGEAPRPRYRRILRKITEKDVRHVEIWKLDSLDVI